MSFSKNVQSLIVLQQYSTFPSITFILKQSYSRQEANGIHIVEVIFYRPESQIKAKIKAKYYAISNYCLTATINDGNTNGK